jgi:ferredoxin-NADP reductase
MVDRFQLRLVEGYMLTPAIRHLVFERVDGQPLAYQPGQFLQVHFHYDDGTATKLLGELPVGGIIDASGPYGRFCLQPTDTAARYLLLATGTGVAPYRAMLPQIEKVLAAGEREVVLLYGARSEAELLYDEEFEAFARTHPGFLFHGCLSRQARSVPRAHDRSGHVQNVLAELGPSAERDIAYLCGNPNMVDAAFAALQEFGLPVKQIRREKYVSSR